MTSMSLDSVGSLRNASVLVILVPKTPLFNVIINKLAIPWPTENEVVQHWLSLLGDMIRKWAEI